MTALGWRFHEVDDLLMSDANVLLRYWHRTPPLHVIVGALLPRGDASAAGSSSRGDVTEFVSAFKAHAEGRR